MRCNKIEARLNDRSYPSAEGRYTTIVKWQSGITVQGGFTVNEIDG
jgi:hypothetical protein